MKGKYPREYFLNPNINKPIEEIWDDIDAYSGEFFEDEVNLHERIDFICPLPPLNYKGKKTKGIFFSQGLGYILKLFPKLKEIFHCGAYSMWSSYPWCDDADFYLNCYKNKIREQYHKNKYQRKKDIIFIPLQDADYTNEYKMAPTFYEPKTIDVLCVATPLEVKNLPILAQAIKIYFKKYKTVLRATFVLGQKTIIKNQDGSLDLSKLEPRRKTQLIRTMNILKELNGYIEFVPHVAHKDLQKYYSASRCCVLASLIEGKNRAINEAMSCNTPVVLFKQHNQWARGEHPIFFGNSGELAEEFSAESLADAIYKVINNAHNYEPRYNYLKHNGRKNFINTIVDYIPYYKDNIPEYESGRFHDNLWVDLAMQENYQLGYYEFLYGKNPSISHVRGINNIETLVKFFYSRFKIK